MVRLERRIDGAGGLKAQLARAKRMRDPAAVKAIKEQLDTAQETLGELRVSIIEQGRAIQAAVIQQTVDGIDKEIADASNGRTRKERDLARRGVDSSSAGGIEELKQADEATAAVINSKIGVLQQQAAAAAATGNPELAKSINESIAGYVDQLDQLTADIAVAAREKAAAATREAVEGIEKQIADAGRGRTLKERELARNGVDSSSSKGLGELLEVDRTFKGVLEGKIAELDHQAGLALASGNGDLAKSINDSVAGYRDQLDQLNTDIITGAREKAAAAAREAVDSAAYGTSFAAAGRDALEIRQRMAELNGGPKFDSVEARQERADYIKNTVVSRLQAEARALQDQAARALADRGGEDETYRQALLAATQKQNEISSAQLEAEELIKGNTADAADLLKGLGGSLSFGFNGQQFTDLINSGIGA